MRRLLQIIFLLVFINLPILAGGMNSTLETYFKNNVVTFMASDWTDYSLTEFFSKNPNNYDYINETFGAAVISQSQSIHGTDIEIKENGDLEGGYDLGIVVLEYDSQNTASSISKLIENAKSKNLKGGKIFVGYTVKQCGNDVVLLYSRAILTAKIKAYFDTIKNLSC